MNPGNVLLIWIAFLMLCPIIDVGGHFINLPEALIYLLFVHRTVTHFSKKKGRARPYGVRAGIRAQAIYGGLFLFAALLASFIADDYRYQYDVFILRNILQVALCMVLFADKLEEIEKRGEMKKFLFRAIGVFCVPAIIVYAQRIDFLSLRDTITDLYKTQFFFLRRETFQSYRYASVFRDFFTAAVYFTMFCSFVFYFAMKATLSAAHRTLLIGVLALAYGAQLFVARSSLVMIPVLAAATAAFMALQGGRVLVRRVLPVSIVMGVVAVLCSAYLLESGLVNKRWAKEAGTFVSAAGRSRVESYAVTMSWYDGISRKVGNTMFSPKHSYNLTETQDPGKYTDSFYGQEVYRYGIYGLFAYSVYLVLMLWASRRSPYLLLLIIALAVLNIKGGNTFFMPRGIYLYSLILAAVPFMSKAPNGQKGVVRPASAAGSRWAGRAIVTSG